MAALPVFVRVILRLGAYQILYLNRIPLAAVVNESVALVKTKPRLAGWAGFVNAVLRALIRTPAPPWPDLTADPIQALSIRYACPEWLVRRWIARYGVKEAERLCRATTVIPPLTIRTNTLQISREELANHLRERGYTVRPTRVSPVGLILDKRGPVSELPFFREGAYYVQDEAAQLIAPLVDPQPNETVLDACAAPGGKTTHLAALMKNCGEIIAVDQSPRRLRLLEENCQRLGVGIVRSLCTDATTLSPSDLGGRLFDRILVDAPCSGLGVLRRHPEAKWQKQGRALERHHALQRHLLERLSHLLRPGGILVYSTCSSEPEENEQVVDEFCRAHPDFSRESVAEWLPVQGSSFVTEHGDLSTIHNDESADVLFAARLRKLC
jgi:16S rRNA (cytosine967-C5)-methyltransferase